MIIKEAIELYAKKHCLHIMSNLTYTGDMRFNEIKKSCKCTSKVLSLLLKKLKEHKLIYEYNKATKTWERYITYYSATYTGKKITKQFIQMEMK